MTREKITVPYSLSEILLWLLFQMVVPNFQKVYGSQYLIIQPAASGFTYFRTYIYKITLTKYHMRGLDQPSQPCSDRIGNPNTSVCIARYIEQQLGCNPRILGSPMSSKTYCKSSSQLRSLANITSRFTQSNAKEIYETTGCLACCERDEYKTLDGVLTQKLSDPIKDLHITFLIASGSYEEKEEYLLYDSQSFMADIGGFLGLLLGWSLFSIYNELVDLVVRFKYWMTRVMSSIFVLKYL